ncbi:hypothetical protein QRE66_14490 [Bacillus cereus]|nr:hypothetical protein QRE66_14490 [Bacillus cereus]
MILDQRSTAILQQVIQGDTYISVEQLMEVLQDCKINNFSSLNNKKKKDLASV